METYVDVAERTLAVLVKMVEDENARDETRLSAAGLVAEMVRDARVQAASKASRN